MRPNKLPVLLRIAAVAGLTVLAASGSLFAYRWYVRPVNLSIAVGSLDGELPKAVSALASRLAETSAPVRLRVVETGFAQLPEDAYRKAYDGNTQGWASELGELVDYLNAA